MSLDELMAGVPQFITELDEYKRRIQCIWLAFAELAEAPKDEGSVELASLRKEMKESSEAAREMIEWSLGLQIRWPWFDGTDGRWNNFRSQLKEMISRYESMDDPLAYELELLGLFEEFEMWIHTFESAFLRDLAVELVNRTK
jgi:hypothetical protein